MSAKYGIDKFRTEHGKVVHCIQIVVLFLHRCVEKMYTMNIKYAKFVDWYTKNVSRIHRFYPNVHHLYIVTIQSIDPIYAI